MLKSNGYNLEWFKWLFFFDFFKLLYFGFVVAIFALAPIWSLYIAYGNC